jgi:hypothetical protein
VYSLLTLYSDPPGLSLALGIGRSIKIYVKKTVEVFMEGFIPIKSILSAALKLGERERERERETTGPCPGEESSSVTYECRIFPNPLKLT